MIQALFSNKKQDAGLRNNTACVILPEKSQTKNKENTMNDIIIVGGGAAGLTAAIYTARAGLCPILATGPLPGGLLTQTTDVENFPGFPDAINGYELMFKFQHQAEKFGVEVIHDTLESVILKNGGGHELTFSSCGVTRCKALIVATGSSPRWLGLESEQRLRTKGVSACATCDGAFFRDVPVVVVGGGDTAMEEATFLTRFASEVHIVHRRDTLRASKIMADRAMANPKITFHWDTIVTNILGTDEVEGVNLKNIKTGAESVLKCRAYFAALGHIPSTAPFKGQLDMDEEGYLKLKDHSSYTNIDGVFAAGDCADKVYRQAVTAAGMGCKAGIDASRWLHANA